MICFRDRTFCPFYEDCKYGLACPVALTPQVEEAARAWWWEENPPISQYAEKPECFEKIGRKK